MPTLGLSVPPVPKGRPRFSAKNGKVRTYTPTATLHAEYEIRRAWMDKKLAGVEGPIKLTVGIYLQRPAGHFGKRGLLPSAPRYPDVKPDLDNYVKTVMDALTGYAYESDGRVVAIDAWKSYCEDGYPEGWTITVEAVE